MSNTEFCRGAGSTGTPAEFRQQKLLFRHYAIHGNTFFTEVLAGGRTLAFRAVVAAAAFAFGKRGGRLAADFAGFFFLAHDIPPEVIFEASL
jgi:hypothetical protein